jgi:hypothetical protein
VKIFRSLQCQKPGNNITTTEVKSKLTNIGMILIIGINRKRMKSCSRVEGLRVLRLTLKPLCYHTGIILNAVPGSLRRPFDGTLHRRLQGDAGVTASKAHQHMVSHRLC